MREAPLRFILVVSLLFGLSGLAGYGTAEAKTVVMPVSQTRALALINGLRKKRGLPPVKADTRLRHAAQKHSNWMARNGRLSHRAGYLGGGLGAKIARVNYPGARAWENVAAGQKSLDEAIDSWMKSSGHRKNMLSRQAVHVGIAAAHNPNVRYQTYWTLILATPVAR